MRHIDHGGRIIGPQLKCGACGQGHQAFTGFQDGQGAKQPARIQRV